MYFSEKNILKNLVVSKEVAILAVPKTCCSSVSTYTSTRNTASSFRGVVIPITASLWRDIRKGLASFIIHTNKLSDQCQRLLKVSTERIVRSLQNVDVDFPTLFAICEIFRSFRKKLSTKYHLVQMCVKVMVQQSLHSTLHAPIVPYTLCLLWDKLLQILTANTRLRLSILSPSKLQGCKVNVFYFCADLTVSTEA